MADQVAQALIRGIDIDKLAKGFADIENIFKQFVTVSKTSSREIRYYLKTSGFLDTPTTDGITASGIENTDFGTLPYITQPSWTRETAHIRKYFVTSPEITIEDLKDSDPDVWGTMVRDLVRAVARKVDARIYSVIAAAAGTSGAASGDGWNIVANGNPILDILTMKQTLYANGYDPNTAILAINSIEYKWLVNFLISVKGSSIPQYASSKIQKGVVTELLNVKIVVSENATSDQALMWIPSRSATYKQFTPISTAIIENPGIGKTIRVWEEGECYATDTMSIYKLTDTID